MRKMQSNSRDVLCVLVIGVKVTKVQQLRL